MVNEERRVQKVRIWPRKRYLIGGGVLLFIIIGGGGFLYYMNNYTGHFPHGIRSKVSIPLYYPVNPPNGVTIDRSSFQNPAKNVVTYTAVDKQGYKFYISLEAVPNNFDFTAFQKKFETTNQINSAVGSGFSGDLGNQMIVSLQTTKNIWILINTTAVTQQGELENLARSLAQTK